MSLAPQRPLTREDPSETAEALPLLGRSGGASGKYGTVNPAPFPARAEPEDDDYTSIKIWMIYGAVSIAELSRGLLLSTLWKAVGSAESSSGVAGPNAAMLAFSLGNLAANPFFGALRCRRRFVDIVLASNLTIAIGASLFCLIPHKDVSFMARFALGFGAGTTGVLRDALAGITTPAFRLQAVIPLYVFQFVAFMVALMIGATLSTFANSVRLFGLGEVPLSAAFIVLSVALFSSALIRSEQNALTTQGQRTHTEQTSDSRHTPASLEAGGNERPHGGDGERGTAVRDMAAVGIACAMNSFLQGVAAAVEIGSITVDTNIFAWERSDAALLVTLLTAIGVALLVMPTFRRPVAYDELKIFADSYILIWCACAMINHTIGSPLDEGLWFQLAIGAAFVLGIPISRVSFISLSTKIFRPPNRAGYLGLIVSAGIIGRLIGQIGTTAIATSTNEQDLGRFFNILFWVCMIPYFFLHVLTVDIRAAAIW